MRPHVLTELRPSVGHTSQHTSLLWHHKLILSTDVRILNTPVLTSQAYTQLRCHNSQHTSLTADMPEYGVLIWSSHSVLWCHNCQHTSLTADMPKYGDPVVQSNRFGHYAHIWSCTFGYKTTAHNNPIYGDSPSAASCVVLYCGIATFT